MKITVDLIGWAGAVALLFAYAVVSFGRLRADSSRYQLLNAFGSCCLIVNTAYYRAYPSTFVNIIWIMIAILASINARRKLTGAGS
jgi:hypothetical protein